MKFKLNKNWIWAVAFAGLTLSSCDDVTEINVDPNSPVAVPASNLVTQAQFSLYNRLHSRVLNAEWGMLMVQHWAQNEYAEESRYLVDANSFDGSWASFYASALNELNNARSIVMADVNLTDVRRANQVAIIDILMADGFNSLTDLWGDIPYSQALSPDFPNPTYDSQSAVYAGLLANLDAAVGSLSGSSSFDSGDIIYGGDVASWKKLGASLMLRMAMRVADADNGMASTYVGKAIAHGLMESNADNGLLVFDAGNPSLSNPLWVDNTNNNRDDFAVSDVLVDYMTNTNDPRLPSFAALNNEGEFRGMPYGLPDAEAFALKSVTSRPSDLVRSAGQPHVIMDYAEVAFLLAEAAERGFTSGSAAGMYAMGITASMEYWGVEGADDYIAANPYDASNWRKSIGEQKWVAFYMNGVQAWAEWRRLDFPQLAVPAAGDISTIPVRLPYPISEDTNNGSSIDAVTTDINDLTGKLWWDTM